MRHGLREVRNHDVGVCRAIETEREMRHRNVMERFPAKLLGAERSIGRTPEAERELAARRLVVGSGGGREEVACHDHLRRRDQGAVAEVVVGVVADKIHRSPEGGNGVEARVVWRGFRAAFDRGCDRRTQDTRKHGNDATEIFHARRSFNEKNGKTAANTAVTGMQKH